MKKARAETGAFRRPPTTQIVKTRYVVGIDLGTSNTALAYVDRRSGRRARDVRDLPIVQLTEAGLCESQRTLPSALYQRNPHELSDAQVTLPWSGREGKVGTSVVGSLALKRGVKSAERLVTSAKSWLCHDAVDRKSSILPWGAGEEIPQVSPIEVQATLLRHLRAAWDHSLAGEDEKKLLANQEVIVTIPASFDEVARELTLQACRHAGFDPLLIEEPQAALYAWIALREEDWRQDLEVGQRILVCDVGGGTTDFSLIEVVADEEGGASFTRTAVGEHLLLGGDNMDLTLARRIEYELESPLEARAFHDLLQSCRAGKIRLLESYAQGDVDAVLPITIASRGSQLVGSALRAELRAQDVVETILEGFFPLIEADAPLPKRQRAGLKEFGLPFAQDPAITRHLRSFLQRHAPEGESLARVDRVLFNGGVFKTATLRERVLDALGKWQPRPPELEGSDLDLAVSRGAAYYGLVRRGKGTRIRGGAGRSYYLEVAKKEQDGGRQALCLIPRGIEEGSVVTIADQALELTANQPVIFPFHTSTVRDDKAGELVPLDEDFDELTPVHTVIRLGRKRRGKVRQVPVELVARYTEIGTLEMWAAAREGEKRWRLELDTRPRREAAQAEPAEGEPDASVLVDPAKLEAAQALLQETFGLPANKAQRALEGLGKALEEALGGAREGWPVPVIRALFDTLLELKETRRRSPFHEARWLNLGGFCLRPGFGSTLDAHRISEMWKLHLQGPIHPKKDPVPLEWIVAFRRISGGLNRGQQETLFAPVSSILLGKARGASRQLRAEYWRLAASLEHLSPKKKRRLGDTLLGLLEKGKAPPRWGPWALGRLGARVPLYGPLDRLLAAQVAAGWLRRLVALKLPANEASFACVQLGRLSADRSRNVSEELRLETAAYLEAGGLGPRALRPLRELVRIEVHTQQELYGDSVPMGLILA